MSINPSQRSQTSAENTINQGQRSLGAQGTAKHPGLGELTWTSSGDNNTLVVKLTSQNKTSQFQIHLTDEFRDKYLKAAGNSDHTGIVDTLVQRAASTYLEQKNALPQSANNVVTFKITDRSFVVRTEKSGFINFIKRLLGISGGYEVKETKIFALDKENISALQSENRDEVLESLLKENSRNLGNLVNDLSKLPRQDIVGVAQSLWELAAEKGNESAQEALQMLSDRYPAEAATALDSWIDTKNGFKDLSRTTGLIASFATTTPDMSGKIVDALSNIAKKSPNKGPAINDLLGLTLQPRTKEDAQKALTQLAETNADAVRALYIGVLSSQVNRDELTTTVKSILVGINNTLTGTEWSGPSGNDKSALEEIRQLATLIAFTLRNPEEPKKQQPPPKAASSEPTSTRQKMSKYELALYSYEGYLNRIPHLYDEARPNSLFNPKASIEFFRTEIFDENKPNPHAYELFIKNLISIAISHPEAEEVVIEELRALAAEKLTIMHTDGSSIPMSESDQLKIKQRIQEELRLIEKINE